MTRHITHILLGASMLVSASGATAQARYFDNARVDTIQTFNAIIEVEPEETAGADTVATDTVAPIWFPVLTDYPDVDAYLAATLLAPYDTLVNTRPMPRTLYMPSIYTGFEYRDSVSPFTSDFSGNEALRWLEEQNAISRRYTDLLQTMFREHPEAVRYNINLLPEAPKRYHATVDPQEHTIKISELPTIANAESTVAGTEVRKRHWIRAFNASLQFSQAYVSPNWYQGGNNNLNALANIYYNVKLNQAYHPNLLFETTAQYKLGINNAPDDEVHSYNISDDLFQLTSTFGLKAAKRWYYSITGLFKTQLLNSYVSNSNDLRSAFLSSGELNLGVGMTYNYVNNPKTVTFDASIAPLSYNLKTCINDRIDPAKFDIEPGHKTRSKFGSSAELKFFWKLCYNINFRSRLFGFTDYNNAYFDWENTLVFEINRFLTTQIYAHLRYDSSTPRCDDPDWHKLQVKEILSIGFAYKFSSI